MKKRLLSVLTVLALALTLAGCTISTPAAVGKIGDIEITSGMYLLCQYQAYAKAQNAAASQSTASSDASSAAASSDAASSAAASSEAAASSVDYTSMSAKKFLAQTITVTADDGTEKDWLVSDYVAAETLKNLQYYAAVKSRFTELGGKLTDDEISTADDNAQSIWDNNSALYQKNGFGLATLKEYQYVQTMASDLLTLIYGPDGESAVSDGDLTNYAENELLYVYYVSVPLYNTSTYAMDTDASATAVAACQAAIDEYAALSAASGTGTATVNYANFTTALNDHLADAYTAVGNTYSSDSLSISSEFLTSETLSSYYSEEQQEQLRQLPVGSGTLIDSSYACDLFVREDPLKANSLDDIRSTVLSDLKGTELQDSLYAYGADTLTNSLDAAAMKKLPASKVVLSAS